MLRGLILWLGAIAVLSASVWPENLAQFRRASQSTIPFQDAAVWEEYGLEAAETASYESPELRFTAAGWRLKDATSALAVFQWQKPPGAQPSALAELAAETPGGVFLVMGNYVLRFDGHKPDEELLKILHSTLPRLDEAALPTLAGYLPATGLIQGSERFVIGPASLAKFEPRISPSLAAFSVGAEAQFARYRSPAGELNLAIFSYPTPHIARERLAEFQLLPGAIVKRTGPLIALSIQPPSADEAEKLLARVNYRANITWSEKQPETAQSMVEFLLAVFTFIGLLLGFTLVAGVIYAGLRLAWRKWFGGPDQGGGMLRLDLDR